MDTATKIELPDGQHVVTITLTVTIAPCGAPVPPDDTVPPPGTTTGDGGVYVDQDGDGESDTIRWEFGDGTWQELTDVDGDLGMDALFIDTNGDDHPDYAVIENADGTYTVHADSDGDGVWDASQVFTRVELDESLPGISALLDSRLDD